MRLFLERFSPNLVDRSYSNGSISNWFRGRGFRPTTSSSLLKKVFEVSLWATLIQDPSARRTKDSQPSGFGFEYCASHVRFRVFQQTASTLSRLRMRIHNACNVDPR